MSLKIKSILNQIAAFIFMGSTIPTFATEDYSNTSVPPQNSFSNIEFNEYVDHDELCNFEKYYPSYASKIPEEFKNAFGKILNSFRIKMRVRSTENYGFIFPIYPEITDWLLKEIHAHPEHNFIELAGASGIHSILALLAGASKVYLNDISPEEIESFNMIIKCLYDNLQDNAFIIEGDLLNISNLRITNIKREPISSENIHNVKCQWVLARNIFHFMTDAKQKDFFHTLKSVMNIDGLAIVTVNAPHEHLLRCAMNDSEKTRFRQILCHAGFKSTEGQKEDIRLIFESFEACRDDIPIGYEKVASIYAKNSEGKLIPHPENLSLIENRHIKENLIQKVNQFLNCLKKNKEEKNLFLGIQLSIAIERSFIPEKLASLFEENGFIVQKTFAVNPSGHVIPQLTDQPFQNNPYLNAFLNNPTLEDSEPFLPAQIGVIARWNGA